MPRELALPRLAGLHRAAVPPAWRRPLGLLAVAWAILGAVAASDWAAMAHQWWDVSTYNHVLLIPPILAWLVWLRAPLLGSLTPAAWWPGLALVAAALFLWLLGTLSGVNSVSQLGAVVSLQAAVLAVLGPRVAAALLFPLAFMLFLVPFGDELVPLLQLVTAELAIALTQWSGVPAVIDGVFIDTPAGLFEVAEACSGVKFLIAMVALGTLVAHTCFRSPARRALFMAAAVALPVVANGVRAWGTIYIAQSQGIEFAAGFDHIFYGWVFFALVMTALLGLSWRWFDRHPEDTVPDGERLARSAWLARIDRFRGETRAVAFALAGVALLFAAWAGVAGSLRADLPERVDLPAVPGWTRVDYAPRAWWEPRATGADHRLLGRYRNRQGAEVDAFVALYSAQGEGGEAGAKGEGALVPGTAWRWLAPGPAVAGGEAEWLLGQDRVKRFAVTWFGAGDAVTGSRARLKLATLADRLLMRARPVTVVILSAEAAPGADPQAAVEAFVAAAGSPGAWMDGLAQVP